MSSNQDRVLAKKYYTSSHASRYRLVSTTHQLRTYSIGLTHVDGVHSVARVLPAYMRAYIRHVPGAVKAVRTVKPRQLAALEFHVIVKIVLSTEDAGT